MSDKQKRRTVLELTQYLGVQRPDIVRYAKCNNLDLKSFCYEPQDYFGSYLEVYDDAFDFFNKIKSDIVNFNREYFSWKSIESICKELGINLTEFRAFFKANFNRIMLFYPNTKPNISPNDELNSATKINNISTKYLYNLYHGFPTKTSRTDDHQKAEPAFNEIIGYEDVKKAVVHLLNPIKDREALDLWGLRPPGGIILYGPPGCGKTFWALQIANYLQFEFREIPRSSFASSYVDGAAKNLKELLDITQSKTALFFDEFDSVAGIRSNSSSGDKENIKVVNTLLQEIPKLIKKDVVIIAATNYLSRIDAAAIRPGRFDLKIPIFPPNQLERATLIYHLLTKDLNQKSPLIPIMNNSNIKSYEFFLKHAGEMTLFSTSLLEDFVNVLKNKLMYLNKSGKQINSIVITDAIIKESILESSTKLTSQDLEFLAKFYLEVNSSLGAVFYNERLKLLKDELGILFKDNRDPPQPIGFRMPNTKK